MLSTGIKVYLHKAVCCHFLGLFLIIIFCAYFLRHLFPSQRFYSPAAALAVHQQLMLSRPVITMMFLKVLPCPCAYKTDPKGRTPANTPDDMDQLNFPALILKTQLSILYPLIGLT